MCDRPSGTYLDAQVRQCSRETIQLRNAVGAHKWDIAILINRYSKLHMSVRWKTATSFKLNVGSGVRQESSFLPTLLTVFVNIFIIHLRALSVGCNVNGCYIGCLMYADDLILLSATVNGLQAMLNYCFSNSTELRLPFNCSKSTCTAIGPGAAHSISDMHLDSRFISWSSSFRYLGITFTGGKKLSVDIDVINRKFMQPVTAFLVKRML